VSDTEFTVRALLDTAGISCSDAEFAAFVDQYQSIRKTMTSLYSSVFVSADPLFVILPDR